ncbi:zinc finger protein 880-like [Athalia rosae]|uniref:zinc finger protein 880-like n=1 Tax=Athalia rosae TaxID=37344 RepID=UPI0020345235|nr:zinc finger protein 880-like [Athalia rosae]
MNFTEDNSTQGTLPQFSELTSRSNVVPNSNYTSADIAVQLQGNQTAVYTTASGPNSGKQQSLAGQINQAGKYPGTLLAWPDPNTLVQLCEKQGMQALNIPNYTQNTATILSVQPNSLPVRIIPNMYFPATSEPETIGHKQQESDTTDIENSSMESQMQSHHQNFAMAEYLQKLQATSLPLTLQQLIKLQAEQLQIKKDKVDVQKNIEQSQNILNIPNVPVLRNGQLQNGTNPFISTENMSMITINPHDLNVHIESQDSENNIQQPIKVEQQVQTDSPKTEKKMKFRAKTGEIKITVALDGSTLYCCPECSLAFPDKGDIEQHIQNHIQERKYQCKECGAMLKRKEHLDQHMRGHSDERPFKCPVCMKAFKRNEHRTRHYVIHSGDKNFTCNVCQKAFSRKDHLNKHTQTHSGIKRTKSKKDTVFTDSKEMLDKIVNLTPKQEPTFVQKDFNFMKQETNFVQHIQNLQKDPNLIQTFSAFKEQALKDGALIQQLAVNMNEILPQNTRYLMPS